MSPFANVRDQIFHLFHQLKMDHKDSGLFLGGQRMLLLSSEAYGCLRNELANSLGKDIARGLIKRFGFQAGFNDGHAMKQTFPDLKTEEQMHLGTVLHQFEGVATIETLPEKTRVDLDKGILNIHSLWHHSLEADLAMAHHGPTQAPQCWSLAGFASGHLSYLLKKNVVALEHECRAQGHDHCRFEVGFRSEMERRYPGCSEDYRSVDLFAMFQSLKTSLKASRNKIKMLEHRLTETTSQALQPIIGSSPQMLRVLEQVRTVASYDSSVLITGASGTGKEVIAKALHKASLRAEKPFIAINCATLSESLQNSELFGHVRGAFTGAIRDRAGLFEQAHEGTLFLDEIGELAAPIQASFLRVLQEGVVTRVGDHREREVNVRIIAATHQDLGSLVKEKRFRQDLYYRLNVIPLHLPPLRERGNDILLLAQHFCERFANRFKKQVEGIDCEVARLFMRHPWQGNIRELYNTMERAVLFARHALIQLDDLPDCLLEPTMEHQQPPPSADPIQAEQPEPQDVPQTLEDQERQSILRAMEQAGGNRGLAADALGISRSTLWRKIKKLGL